MIYSTGGTTSNRIMNHTGYSWAADYQNGTAVRSVSGATRIVEDRALAAYRRELKAQRFGDNYEYREPGTARNTNSIYPEYVKQQRMLQMAQEQEINVCTSNRLDTEADVKNSFETHSVNSKTERNNSIKSHKAAIYGSGLYTEEPVDHMDNSFDSIEYEEETGCSRYEHGSSIYAVENVNYKKFMITMAALITALVACMFMLFVRNVSASDVSADYEITALTSEVPQEEIVLNVGLVE